jgi:outer membrane protein assembly factor BamB
VTVDGKLIINCDGGIRPGLLCLDFKTGKELWHAERPGTIVSYASPFVWKHGNQTEILQAGTAQLASYDISDGSPLWQVNNLPIFICPSPTADEEAVYFGAWTTGNVSGGTRIESLFSEENGLTPEQISNPEAFYARFDSNKDRKLSRDELPPSRLKEAFNYSD